LVRANVIPRKCSEKETVILFLRNSSRIFDQLTVRNKLVNAVIISTILRVRVRVRGRVRVGEDEGEGQGQGGRGSGSRSG